MDNFLDHALAYASLGWHVFPCLPRKKKPLTGSHGCKDATCDPAQIRRWWTQTPDANIGLACGARSGVYVVDVDVKPDENVDGWQTLKKFEELPATVTSESPRGGAHFLYKTDNPPANKNSLFEGIDIRGEGYYIVLPPSIFEENGKVYPPYTWKAGHAPGEIELAEYPEFMRPQKKPVPPWQSGRTEAKPAAISAPVSVKPSIAGSARMDVIERARRYLAECEPAVQGHAGHDKLLWAARAMVSGFLLDEGTATALLETEFNPRCSPPWDLADAREARDFRRKVSEAVRVPSTKMRGWLLDEYGLRGDDARLDKLGQAIAENLLNAHESAAEQGGVPGSPMPAEKSDTGERIEDWLLNPPGLVGDVCRWINETSLKRQPLLTLAAALTFCGAIMGRKVRDEWDNRTNLYSMSVAQSSAGKGHARKQIKRLIDASEIGEMLGGEDVTSDASIEKRLQDQPVTFFLWDEIGHMMASIKANSTNPHLSKVVPTLMKLYSAAGETYVGKEYATGERREIVQPCCALYGTTTPDKLMDGISPDEIKDGWLGRVLVFVSTDNPRKDFERARAGDVPAELIERVRKWVELRPEAPAEIAATANIKAAKGVWQCEIATAPEAQRRFLKFEELADAKADSSASQTKGIDRLWGKAGENARKIALIVACGDEGPEARVSELHADYACKLVAYLIEQLAKMVLANVAESQFEKDKQFLLRIIEAAGEKGISKNIITRRTQKYNQRLRDEYLKDLEEANSIVMRRDSLPIMLYKYPYG